MLLAIPGNAVHEFAHDHAKELDGRIVIDATNSIGGPSAHQWEVFGDASPKAGLYRAFNVYGFEVYDNAVIGGVQPDLFYAGPEGSRDEVEGLIRDVGLNPIWVGGADAADTVDGVLRLWFTLARRHGRHIAFKLIKD